MWLNEGLANYFGASKNVMGKIHMGKIDKNSMMAIGLQNFLKEGIFIHLKNIVSDKVDLNINRSDEKQANFYYVGCWVLVHFLIHYQNGCYEQKFFELIKKGGGIPAFEKLIGPIDKIHIEWLEYIKKLEFND
jgi:hypothetical protein